MWCITCGVLQGHYSICICPISSPRWNGGTYWNHFHLCIRPSIHLSVLSHFQASRFLILPGLQVAEGLEHHAHSLIHSYFAFHQKFSSYAFLFLGPNVTSPYVTLTWNFKVVQETGLPRPPLDPQNLHILHHISPWNGFWSCQTTPKDMLHLPPLKYAWTLTHSRGMGYYYTLIGNPIWRSMCVGFDLEWP